MCLQSLLGPLPWDLREEVRNKLVLLVISQTLACPALRVRASSRWPPAVASWKGGL